VNKRLKNQADHSQVMKENKPRKVSNIVRIQ